MQSVVDKKTVEKRKILVTGHLGFIGSAVVRNLRAAGHDVWGIDKRGDSDDRSLAADLLDSRETGEAISRIGSDIQVVIHMAALAHGEKPPSNWSMFDFNVTITRNMIDGVRHMKPHIIFLSSVAVYGEDDRPGPVGVNTVPRPASEYGLSKLVCEKLVSDSRMTKYDILRIAPVYDSTHLQDVSKRVYLPGVRGIKMRILPQPYHSLCHIDLVGDVIRDCVLRADSGERILNVADPLPHPQHDLVEWFKGITIPFPTGFALPLYLGGKMIPGAKGYAIRCLFSKLFRSNVYTV